jgi:hypothetical protein
VARSHGPRALVVGMTVMPGSLMARLGPEISASMLGSVGLREPAGSSRATHGAPARPRGIWISLPRASGRATHIGGPRVMAGTSRDPNSSHHQPC